MTTTLIFAKPPFFLVFLFSHHFLSLFPSLFYLLQIHLFIHAFISSIINSVLSTYQVQHWGWRYKDTMMVLKVLSWGDREVTITVQADTSCDATPHQELSKFLGWVVSPALGSTKCSFMAYF